MQLDKTLSFVSFALLLAACSGESPSAATSSDFPDSASGNDGAMADGATPDTDRNADAGMRDGSVPDAHEARSCPAGMVLVPAGPFVMGSDTGSVDERPKHTVTLSSYCLDTTEVTNGSYRACSDSGGCLARTAFGSRTRNSYYGDPAYDRYPMIELNWNAAKAYCTWASKRLPTEAEWEKAARGGCELQSPATCGPEDEREYPWGDAVPTCTLANFSNCLPGGGDTDLVGARPAGDSPYQAHDLAGNVAEWVSDYYYSDYLSCAGGCSDPAGPPTGQDRVYRGGSYSILSSESRVARRFALTSGGSDPTIGFRCATAPH